MAIFTEVFEDVVTEFTQVSRRRDEVEHKGGRFPFDELDRSMDQLADALDWAIRKDDKEANSFWRKLKGFLSGQLARFKAEARKIKAEARMTLAESQRLYQGRIAPHREAVDRLNEDASGWTRRNAEVVALRREAASLERVAGWSGPASEEYASAVRIQVGALNDLGKVMMSAAMSCQKGARDNAQRFTNVRLVVNETWGNIRRARGGGGKYYQRTAAAIRSMTVMIENVDDICFGVGAVRFAADLARENQTSASQGIILTNELWPEGTEETYTLKHTGTTVHR